MDYLKLMSDSELLVSYNDLRMELSDLDSEDNFEEYSELETELDMVFAELELRGL